MMDATQKLVDEAPAWLDRHGDVWVFRNGMGWSFETQPFTREHIEKKWGPLVPLEAAQRLPVSPEHDDLQARLDEAEEKLASLEAGCVRLTRDELIQRITAVGPARWKAGYWLGEQRAKWEAERPPVSPEVREEIRAVVGEQLTKAGLDLDGPPYSDDGETQWPVALELRDRLTDALLARFSVPSQPVYDEEAVERVAKALHENPTDWQVASGDWGAAGHAIKEQFRAQARVALVAALRGGELTREETNE